MSYAVVPSRRVLPFGAKPAAGQRRLPSAAAPRQLAASPSLAVLLTFFGGHAALGLAMKQFPALATAHAWLSLSVGLYWAASARSPGKTVAAICYLAGAEVLWRMAGASVFWEFGKYAVCAVALVAWLRHRPPHFNWLALLYFGLLLPSIILTVLAGFGFTTLRGILSFNLSGPLSIAVCAFCWSRLRLRAAEADRSLLAILGPITGAAAVCLLGTASLGADYEFGSESNFNTSGGFGPNQVSSVLGLGMLAGFLWMQRQPWLSARWWLSAALVLGFAAQATLTFSRTGIWMGLITIGVAAFFLMGKSAKALPGLIGALLVFGMLYFVVFRSLDQFTGGKLSERYAEKGFTGREDIAKGDLLLALDNPLLGVGPGMAKLERSNHRGIAAHTEFTRVLAEHGLTGLLALGALLLMAVHAFKSASGPWQMAWTASFIAYSLLFMMASGMRLAVPSVGIGLAMVRTEAAAGGRRRRVGTPDKTRGR